MVAMHTILQLIFSRSREEALSTFWHKLYSVDKLSAAQTSKKQHRQILGPVWQTSQHHVWLLAQVRPGRGVGRAEMGGPSSGEAGQPVWGVHQ